ncbi:MAG TPA: hypothetical protein PLZ57_12280 [Pseudobdellovibrionaceae bacterium]|nr:hypothetical protein [Pseudobdellovibrionaceae bacterium]
MKQLVVESGRNWTFISSNDFSKFGWIVFSRQFARLRDVNSKVESLPCSEILNATMPIECISEHVATLSPIILENPSDSEELTLSPQKHPPFDSIETTLNRLARIRHKNTQDFRNPIAVLEITNSIDEIRFRCVGEFEQVVTRQFEHLFNVSSLPFGRATDSFASKAGFALPPGNSGCDILMSVPASLFFDTNYSNITGFTNKLISTIAFGLVASSTVISDSRFD